jgi:hypothetical protein
LIDLEYNILQWVNRRLRALSAIDFFTGLRRYQVQ